MGASIAGQLLDASGPRPAWGLTPGVKPLVRTFILEKSAGKSAFKSGAGGLVTLTIGVESYQVVIESTTAGNSPHTIGLVVKDVRYLLQKKTITRDYNIRRRSGRKRLVGEGRIEDRPRVDDVTYIPGTLNGATPWNVNDALKDVLNELGVPYEFADVKRQVPFEGLRIDDDGGVAIAKILSYVPGYELVPTLDGKLTLKDSLDGGEESIVNDAGPIENRTGAYLVADRRFERPVDVEVLIDREVELRFDHNEEDIFTVVRGEEPLFMEAVLPSPDVQITIGKRKVGQTEYITFNEAFAAWANDWPAHSPGKKLDYFRLRKYFLSPNRMRLYTLPNKGQKPDRLRSQRVAVATRNMRRTYRILPAWMTKIRSLSASRIAIVDAETGQRANSRAYMDWTEIPTERGLGVAKKGDVNTETFSHSGYAALLKNAQAAPGQVTLRDPELGIVELNPSLDAAGNVAKIIAGKLVDLSGNVGLGPQVSAAEAFAATLAGFALQSGFKLSIVLVATQQVPNNNGRHHSEIVTAAEAGTALGRPVGESLGPRIQIRIQPSATTTARYAWSDQFAQEIKDAFFKGGPISRSLLVNEEDVRALAVAAAALVYELLQDRLEGAAVHSQVSGLTPQGGVATVESLLSAQGGPRTRLNLPRRVGARSSLSLLPDEIRDNITRRVRAN